MDRLSQQDDHQLQHRRKRLTTLFCSQSSFPSPQTVSALIQTSRRKTNGRHLQPEGRCMVILYSISKIILKITITNNQLPSPNPLTRVTFYPFTKSLPRGREVLVLD